MKKCPKLLFVVVVVPKSPKRLLSEETGLLVQTFYNNYNNYTNYNNYNNYNNFSGDSRRTW